MPPETIQVVYVRNPVTAWTIASGVFWGLTCFSIFWGIVAPVAVLAYMAWRAHH